MKGLDFPIIGTKVKGVNKKFDISDPSERKAYFQAKVGDEIKHINKFLDSNTFIAYFLGKKNSGKGTYSKMFVEIFGSEHVATVSVGDIVRDTHANWDKFIKSKDYELLKRYYRGYMSFKEATDAFLGRTQDKLLPSEFVLALLKVYIEKLEGKTVLLDGLPRENDQVSYSLYFRDLINYRNDPDLFVLIDIPENVIDERIKYRVVCPVCNTPRNTKLLATSKVEYDVKTKEFYLVCDTPGCTGGRMVAKEGDELGIEPIRPRLVKDEEILKSVFGLHGVPKILLRNAIPVKEAKTMFDEYEITPQFDYILGKNNKVEVIESPWVVKDDEGRPSHSLMPAPVVVSMIKQMVDVLNL